MEGDDRKRVWVTITRVRCERETVRGHERGSKTVRGRENEKAKLVPLKDDF